ncbi:MAG: hypothetical protein H8E13_02080 [Actinobacteria bacterium]|nr:hypothetical protein [Actinomycetota bacterium]
MSYNKTSKLVEGKFGSLDIIGDIHTNGNIIAENYIISSSVTHMTTSFSSGSTIFGDTLDDTHQFTGSIYVTGSLEVNGDISSSGDIYLEDTKGLYFTGNGRGTISGSLLNIKLNGSYGFLIYSGSDITFKIDNNNNGNIGIGTGYTTDAKLTVNGDISASGDFYSNGQNITGSGG